MGSDAKNLMGGGNVRITKTDRVIDATQLAEGELIVEAGTGAENIMITGVGWLKVAANGIAKRTQYGNNGTLPINDGAIVTNIVQSGGGTISPSTLATANGRHPEDKFSVGQDYACGLSLENGGDLCILEGHHTEKIILDQEGGLLVNETISTVVVDEGGELLVYSGGETSNYEVNQGGVFMLAGKANDTLFVSGTMNNLGSKDSDTTAENGAIYRLGTGGLQLYSSDRTQDLSINVGGRAEVHASMLESAVIQSGTVILLSPINADENFAVEEDCIPVELTGSVALLDGASMIIGHGVDLQQSMITVQQGGVLILDGGTIKGNSATFSVGNINLNSGKLWLIIGVVTHV